MVKPFAKYSLHDMRLRLEEKSTGDGTSRFPGTAGTYLHMEVWNSSILLPSINMLIVIGRQRAIGSSLGPFHWSKNSWRYGGEKKRVSRNCPMKWLWSDFSRTPNGPPGSSRSFVLLLYVVTSGTKLLSMRYLANAALSS